MIKLSIIKTNSEWLEATWINDETVLHCESFSGHKEHIEMLRNKAAEYGTELNEYEDIITEVINVYVYPTEEEIAKEELKNKIAEAKAYLNKTDKKFFIGYKPKEDEDLVLIEKLRDEARDFIRANS